MTIHHHHLIIQHTICPFDEDKQRHRPQLRAEIQHCSTQLCTATQLTSHCEHFSSLYCTKYCIGRRHSCTAHLTHCEPHWTFLHCIVRKSGWQPLSFLICPSTLPAPATFTVSAPDSSDFCLVFKSPRSDYKVKGDWTGSPYLKPPHGKIHLLF